MKKTIFSRLALVLAFALLLSAFTFSTAFATKANDTLIYGIEGDPGNDLNTISTSGRFDLMAERMLYSTLFNYFGPDDITYLLAESVETSADLMTYTVKLRKDVKWSDGVPFTADDVVFTYSKIIEFPYANGHAAFVYGDKNVEVVKIDDYTVEFRMPQLVNGFLEMLTNEHYMMPKHIYEGDATLDNNVKNQTPVGTGPYTLEEYKAGQYTKFKANPNYFLGAPKIGTIIFQVVSDPSSAALALKKGEINALVIANSAAEDYAGTPVTVYAYPEDRVGYMSFNLASSRVSDINLRKACFYALNRTEMNIGAYVSEDFFVNAVSFLPYNAAFYTSEVEAYDTNLDTAKEYLAKVSDVPTLRLAYGSGNAQQEVQAMVIQQNLKAIGVNVEILAMDINALIDKMENGSDEYEMFLGGYIMGVDPVNYSTLFTSDSSSNYAHMSDPELDQLFADGAIATDTAARAEIYKKAQQRLADLAIFYPIVTNSRLLAMTSDVGGVEDARLVPIYTFENMGELYFN
ncbi:MAG: ABC transporter substrate-binding protein [Clostridia bacterium]